MPLAANSSITFDGFISKRSLISSSMAITDRLLSLLTAVDALRCDFTRRMTDKNAQLSLTNPRDAKACQKLLQFDVLTTLSLTILAYLHLFSCCCVRNLRNPTKFTENSNLWSSRSSKVIDLGVNRRPMYDFLLVTNSNFGRICYRFRDIDAQSWKIAEFSHYPSLRPPSGGTPLDIDVIYIPLKSAFNGLQFRR